MDHTATAGAPGRDLTGVLLRQQRRVREIAEVFGRYGLAGLANRAAQAHDETRPSGVLGFASLRIDPELVELTTGQGLRGALTELGTTWVKLGQMLGVRPDIVGPDIAEELSKLQSGVPADRPGHAEQLIAAELGASVSELFASFDPVPAASGSVAQVHRARTVDGAEVVVKVLHAGVERRVAGDLELMAALARFAERSDPELARFHAVRLVAEFERIMRSAIDLRDELRNLQQFTRNFSGTPDVLIPRAYPELSSRRVLTMEYMTGTVLSDQDSVERSGWQADGLVRRTNEIYLQMMFRDGVYHADPHPGNFLLRPDQLVILDFGDVGVLSQVRRRQFEAMLLALGARDLDDLTDAIVDITQAPADTNLVQLSSDLEALMRRYLQGDLGEIDLPGLLGALMEGLRKNDLQLPSELALLFRVVLLLHGLSLQIDGHADFSELLQPYTDLLIRERTDPQAMLHEASRRVRRWNRLLDTVPDDLGVVLNKLRGGGLDTDLELHDPDGRVELLVDGMLTAALTLGAAELVSRQARPAPGGVSLPGAIALLGAAWTYRRVRSERRGYTRLSTQVGQAVRAGVKLVQVSRRNRRLD